MRNGNLKLIQQLLTADQHLRGRIAPRGAARAQVPRSAARRVPVSGWAAPVASRGRPPVRSLRGRLRLLPGASESACLGGAVCFTTSPTPCSVTTLLLLGDRLKS